MEEDGEMDKEKNVVKGPKFIWTRMSDIKF